MLDFRGGGRIITGEVRTDGDRLRLDVSRQLRLDVMVAICASHRLAVSRCGSCRAAPFIEGECDGDALSDAMA